MRKAILPGIMLSVIIILSGLAQLIFNENFYQKEHVKNNVTLEDNVVMTENLISYLQGRDDLKFFNEKERLHLQDVKNLIIGGFILYYSLIALFLVWLVFLYDKDFSMTLSRILSFSAITVTAMSVVSFALSGFFDFFFIRFHHVFFNNDYWLLNPMTDQLIVLLPEQFFIDIVFHAILRSLTIALFMFGFAFMLYHGSRQK